MRRRPWAILEIGLTVLVGCAFGTPGGAPPPVPVLYQNPSLVPATNHALVWDQVADVVSDYFRIQNEQRVQIVGNVITEGRIDTYPQGGATLLEPQRKDSVGSYNRLESTLQTIRRRAHIRVIPAQGGFLVEVVVEKELEDLPHPERAIAGTATFRTDSSPHDFRKAPKTKTGQSPWIPLGRDVALEQKILADIHTRLGGAAPGMAY